MIFGRVDVLPVYRFLQTYFRMVTKLNDYVTFNDDDVDADFRYNYRGNTIAQFEQDLKNRSFSQQEEGKCHHGLQKRIKIWFNYVVTMEWPISENVYG